MIYLYSLKTAKKLFLGRVFFVSYFYAIYFFYFLSFCANTSSSSWVFYGTMGSYSKKRHWETSENFRDKKMISFSWNLMWRCEGFACCSRSFSWCSDSWNRTCISDVYYSKTQKHVLTAKLRYQARKCV